MLSPGILAQTLDLSWVALLIYLSFTDARSRILPNQAVLLLILLALASGFLNDGLNFFDNTEHLFISFLVGLGGIALYALKVWGAGDAKMLFALALALPGRIGDFLLLVAIFGGLLSTGIWVVSRLRPNTNPTVPYGIALSLGAFVMRFCL